MFNFVKSVFGQVSVEENNGVITVSAVRSKDALAEIYNHWKTSRIESGMFKKITPYSLSFYSFFAIEFTYILDQLIKKKGRSAISKSTLSSVKRGMLENTWLKSTTEEHPDILNRSKLNLFSKTPLKHQEEFFARYNTIVPKFQLKGYTLAMGTGTGKAQSLDSLIRVPGGWKRMGDIKVGDIVIAVDGTETTVKAVFPQGKTELWKITFEDGRSTKVNPEHLWEVVVDGGIPVVLPTSEIKRLLPTETITVPLFNDRGIEKSSEKMDFYGVGKALAKDADIIGSVIPEIYFELSHQERSILLSGILSKDDNKFTGYSLSFMESLKLFVYSLGHYATLGCLGDLYVLTILKTTGKERLKVLRIEELEPEETQCIMIDHPRHLYVTDDYIVTHNTFTSLALSEMLEPDYIIMVSIKASIYRVWEAAMNEDYKTPTKYWIYDRDKVLPSSPPKYLIYHYDALEYLYRDANKFIGKKVSIIFDESHSINEMTASRTVAALKISERVKPISVIWASATPIKAMGSEAIPMLTTFDPLMTPPVQDAFKTLYGKNSKKCHDIINHRLGNVIFKVDVIKSNPIISSIPVRIKDPKYFLLETLKADMKKYIAERVEFWKAQMPTALVVKKKVFAIVEKSLKTREQRKQFEQYKDYFDAITRETQYEVVKEEMKFCNDYEKNVIAPLLPPQLNKDWKQYKSVIKYLDLKVRGECLGNVVSKRREECTLAMIDACDLPKFINEAEKKTIIFTSYVKAVDDTTSYLKGKGFSPVAVHGNNGEDLTSQVNKFFNDSKSNPLVATYQSLSTSVPLIAANVILALNVPFRDYIFEQAVGRIDRINQTAQTYVYKFVLDTGDVPNISSRTLDIMTWSAEQVDKILGVTSPVALENLEDDLGHFITPNNYRSRQLAPDWFDDLEIDYYNT